MTAEAGTRDFDAFVEERNAPRTAPRPWDDGPPRTVPPPAARSTPPAVQRRRHARRRNAVLLTVGLLLVLPWLFAQPDPDIALNLALTFMAVLLAGLTAIGVAAGGLASSALNRRALFSRLLPIAAGCGMVVIAARLTLDPAALGFVILDGTGPRIPDLAHLEALALCFDAVAGAAFALRSLAGLAAALWRHVHD